MTRRIFEEKRYTVQGHILPRDAFFPMGKRDWRPTAENAARLISEAETILTEDIPTLFISLANPYHFADVPMIRTILPPHG